MRVSRSLHTRLSIPLFFGLQSDQPFSVDSIYQIHSEFEVHGSTDAAYG